jgi:conjugative relaxase-like TrwC/TraI family protein
MRVLSAGEGYRYLLKTVAAGDGDRDLSTPLTRYYTEQGTPPGRWLGTGLTGLGDRLSGALGVGDEVTEEQLRRLLGQGRDPVTGAALGRAYPKYRTTAERVEARTARLDPGLSDEARAVEVERITIEETGRGRPRTVAGFDFTFSVPKSVSTLWAVADGGTQALIAQAHRAAIGEVIELIERDVAATRTGAGGVAQVDVRGVVATAFDHYDSRAGDPQLHTHVVIANRVQAADGKWRTLDGRPMHTAVVAVSEHYNAILADHLTRVFGIGWDARDRGRDRNPAWEITGVPDELLSEFSSRTADIEAEKDRLIDAYVTAHGHQPTAQTIIRLRQQATLTTRPDKELRSLAELTTGWRARAATVLGEDATTWAQHLTAANPRPLLLRADDLPLDELRRVGEVVVARVGQKRSTWRSWNLHAEASRQLMGLRFASTTDREAVLGLITDAAENASLQLSPPELTSTPAAFRRQDGSSVFRPKHHTVYSSMALLEAEDRLLDLSRTTTAPTVPLRVVSRVVSRPDAEGRVLSSDQARVAEQIATSARTLDLLVGPAGTGKTTTLGALRRAWEREHGAGSVIGLAPSAAAAEVLAADLGIPTENTAKWRHEHDQGRWDLTAGQLVLIDEASLAGTLALEEIASHAAAVGAKVVLIGDWGQLTAIDAGGAFGLLVRDRGDAPELVDVRRFAHDWEKAASLRLRLGHADVLDTYDHHGRLVGGDYDTILEDAYTAWQADTAAGKTSVLIAETTDTVTTLNARARTDRVLAGHVTADGVRLHDGNLAGTGDLILTRDNDRRLTTGRAWVKNGDRWQVVRHHEDGSLTVRRHPRHRRGGGTVVLPAAYVAAHVELSYAVTVHRAQGSTVDTAHAIVHSESMTREAFYVAMTRGRHQNTAYVATDAAHLEDHQTHDGEQVTASTVLYGVLAHEGTEASAHETITAEHEAWSSIAHLADQYETIAQQAQAEHVTALLDASGLAPEQVEDVIASETFGSLIAELRRGHANGAEPANLIRRAVTAGALDTEPDLAATLRNRIGLLASRASGGTRGHRTRLIAGLIPEAAGPMPADMTHALTELQDLIEHRATVLATGAVADRAAWLQDLGPAPSRAADRAAWERELSTVIAYRDRYNITTPTALGPATGTQLQRTDRQRADAAVRRAQRYAASPSIAVPTATRAPVSRDGLER